MSETPPFINQADTTRDLWAETHYPLCAKLGLRITPAGPAGNPPAGIPHEALRERLQATGCFGRWCEWAGGGLTVGINGVYPWDVENFLAGLPNHD